MHAIDDIELVTYSVETQKDENENILEVATTAFSGLFSSSCYQTLYVDWLNGSILVFVSFCPVYLFFV